jgi:RecB family endonuclease NucS
VDENKRLVVLELKNGEDRYVVQQLTRYYDALLEHKPFADRVDYDRPVRLIAITPKFHRDII